MKSFRVFAALFFLFVFIQNSFPQVGAALQVLTLNPSPRLNGLGMVGVSFPNDGPYGFYYNPAMLGYMSQTENLSYQVDPSNGHWMPDIFKGTYKNSSFNFGYNFEKLLNGLKLSAGFGYIHSKMDYGSLNANPALNDSYDEYDDYGFGVGLDYYIQINAGLSYKSTRSLLAAYSSNGSKVYEADVSSMDYGLLMTVPVTKLIEPGLQLNLLKEIPAVPYLNVSMGYSQLNIGKEIYYIDPAQKDPIPRTARLGYTLSAGIDLKLNNSTLKAFEYDFIAEADDYLITRDPNTFAVSYQGGFGDINVGKNLIQLKGDNNVVVHKGHDFSIFETVEFMIGRFDGTGYYQEKSYGFGIRARGILTLLKAYTSDRIFNYIADHVDIEYYTSTLFPDDFRESKLQGISVMFGGFMF